MIAPLKVGEDQNVMRSLSVPRGFTALAAPEHRPGWIRVDRLLGEHGIQADSVAGREQFERRMEQRRLEEEPDVAGEVFRRGWCLGSKEFKEKMLELMDGKLGENHSGRLTFETAEQKAGRIIAEELLRRKWTEEDLQARMKNDPAKLAIAERLRKETTLSIKWIAARLAFETPKSARALLHQWMQNHAKIPKPHPCAQMEFQPMV